MRRYRLRELREDHDLSQQALADYLKITQTSYSKYELGQRGIPVEALDQLADYYYTSVDYLIRRTDKKQPYPKSEGWTGASAAAAGNGSQSL